MKKLLNLLSLWLPALGVMAVIFVFSSIPSTRLPRFDVFDLLVKKGGHMLGYALLAVSYLRGFGGRGRSLGWYGLAFLLTVFYAASDEFHQSFVAGRGATLVDVGIDSVGALLGLTCARVFRKTD